MKNLDLLIPQAKPETDRFTWGTVINRSPAKIRLDGDDEPLDIVPDSLVDVDWLDIGRRVWCQVHGRRVIILGQHGKWRDSALDTGWIIPTLVGTWANYGSTFADVAYRKRDGIVYLRGLPKSGALNSSIFFLPPGFRPDSTLVFGSIQAAQTSGAASTGTAHTHLTANTSVRIDVKATGEVQPQGMGAAATPWVSLSNISFPADA